MKTKKSIYIALISIIAICLLCGYIPSLIHFSEIITPPVVLLAGLAYALIFGQTYSDFNKKMSKSLLQYAIVGLGFGMNVEKALESGKEGMLFTIISVFGTLAIGWIIGRKLLKVNSDTSYLISSGTAICGGSAIAAVGSTMKAKSSDMTVALGTVFILNALALFIFPPIGHHFEMSQHDFGTWAAIAIHDTSSVVGAGQAYGEEALEVATTIKLTRALWIVPLTLLTSFIYSKKQEGENKKQISVPMFIILFIAALLFNTYILSNGTIMGDFTETGLSISNTICSLSKKCLTLALFFIGAGLSRKILQSVGIKPMLMGIMLWVIISIASLAYILL